MMESSPVSDFPLPSCFSSQHAHKESKKTWLPCVASPPKSQQNNNSVKVTQKAPPASLLRPSEMGLGLFMLTGRELHRPMEHLPHGLQFKRETRATRQIATVDRKCYVLKRTEGGLKGGFF
uniref:Uncharacterized protein n=1 Tax=Sphaerodactylus townsendi TaxID=933632 RepID=A0ACB8EEJ5_9SAUR